MNVYIRLHEGGIFLSLSCLCGLCIDRDTRQAVLFCRLSIQNKKMAMGRVRFSENFTESIHS